MIRQVAIIGAGPAGLLLGHLLRQAGLDAVIVECHTAAHVLSRIRAGVLEATATDILVQLGLDQRMNEEGLLHDGVNLTDGERMLRIDLAGLTGKQVMVYGQTEVTKDLIDAAPARGLEIIWEAEDVALHGIDTNSPHLTFVKDGAEQRIDADSAIEVTANREPPHCRNGVVDEPRNLATQLRQQTRYRERRRRCWRPLGTARKCDVWF